MTWLSFRNDILRLRMISAMGALVRRVTSPAAATAQGVRLFDPAVAVPAAEADLGLARLDRLPGERRLPARRLGQHILGLGATVALAGTHRGFYAQHLVDAAVDAGIDRLEILDGEAVEGDAALLGVPDDVAGDLVRLAERDV